MPPSRTCLPLKKNPTEQTNVRHSKCKARKRLGAQELKWCVFVLCVVSKDAFQKADDCEKIYMEISWVLDGLSELAWPAQALGSPADQCNLWTESFVGDLACLCDISYAAGRERLLTWIVRCS